MRANNQLNAEKLLSFPIEIYFIPISQSFVTSDFAKIGIFKISYGF